MHPNGSLSIIITTGIYNLCDTSVLHFNGQYRTKLNSIDEVFRTVLWDGGRETGGVRETPRLGCAFLFNGFERYFAKTNKIFCNFVYFAKINKIFCNFVYNVKFQRIYADIVEYSQSAHKK